MDKLERITVHHPPSGSTSVVTRGAFVAGMAAKGWQEIDPQPRVHDLVDDADLAREMLSQGATVEYVDGEWVVVEQVPPVDTDGGWLARDVFPTTDPDVEDVDVTPESPEED